MITLVERITPIVKSSSKISGSLSQYYRDEQSLNDNGVTNNFPGDSVSFKFKQKVAGGTGADGIKFKRC